MYVIGTCIFGCGMIDLHILNLSNWTVFSPDIPEEAYMTNNSNYN